MVQAFVVGMHSPAKTACVSALVKCHLNTLQYSCANSNVLTIKFFIVLTHPSIDVLVIEMFLMNETWLVCFVFQ